MEGNTHSDAAMRSLYPLFSDAVESHGFFHQNARSLMKMFSISSQQARAIVNNCSHCTPFQGPMW